MPFIILATISFSYYSFLFFFVLVIISLSLGYQIQFVRSLGSVIFPVTADAATTIGDARYVFDSMFPILPGKFLLVVLTHISSLPRTPICAPQHAPQVGGPTTAPASRNMLIRPSLMACMYIDWAAGKTSVLVFTFLPFNNLAAER